YLARSAGVDHLDLRSGPAQRTRHRDDGRGRRAGTRRGIDEERERSRRSVHGISTPGLRISNGSTAAFTPRSMATPTGPTSRASHGRWSVPTAWWWVIVAPASIIASDAAALAAHHCASGSSA